MTAALEAKIDGLQREQNGMAAWLERLSLGIERVADFGATMAVLQTKQAHTDGVLSDLALDVNGHEDRLSSIESNNKIGRWVSNSILALISTVIGASIAYAIPKILGS